MRRRANPLIFSGVSYVRCLDESRSCFEKAKLKNRFDNVLTRRLVVVQNHFNTMHCAAGHSMPSLLISRHDPGNPFTPNDVTIFIILYFCLCFQLYFTSVEEQSTTTENRSIVRSCLSFTQKSMLQKIQRKLHDVSKNA